MGLKGVSAAEQLSQLAEGLQKNFARSAMPSGLASMIDASRSYERLASPHAGLSFAGTGKLASSISLAENLGAGRVASGRMLGLDLHERFARTTSFLAASGQLGELQRSIAGLALGGNESWRSITKVAERFSAGSSRDLQLSRVAGFDRALRQVLPEPAHLAWSKHLQITALGTATLLRHDWSAAVAVITAVPEDRGGVISWLSSHGDQTLMMTAAISAEDAAPVDDPADGGLPVTLEAEYVCAICEEPMMTFDRELRWLGPGRGIVRRRIFPMCPRCWEEEQQNEGFLFRALCDLTRPAMGVVREVIPGGQQGDGRPRARLRLVPKKD